MIVFGLVKGIFASYSRSLVKIPDLVTFYLNNII